MAIQSKLIKKVVVIGGTLAAVQILAIIFMSSGPTTAAKSPQESIDAAVSKLKGLSPERRDMMKVQVALADYMAKHGGMPPRTLNELVGTYFQTIPIDPTTNRQYKYTVEGTRYFLGDKPTAPAGQASKTSTSAIPAPGAQKTLTPKELESARDELLRVLTQDDSQKNPAYDPAGKRDPFKPFEIAPKDSNTNAATPLQTLAIDKLSYSAYVESEAGPKAIVETPEGRGYTASKGMKIGLNDGEITDILPEKIIIVETQTDFTGQKQNHTIELPIGVRREGGITTRGTR